MLNILQHKVEKSGDSLHCLLETGLKRKSDLVLVQEPPLFNGYAHPGFDLIWTKGRTMAARRRDSTWTFSTEDHLTQDSMGDVLVIAAGKKGGKGRKIRIANTYSQKVGREGRVRPAESADWDNILTEDCVVAGDFNAHSPRWNPLCTNDAIMSGSRT